MVQSKHNDDKEFKKEKSLDIKTIQKNGDFNSDIKNWKEIHIVYEDNHIIAAVKLPGILSQADETADPDMLCLIKQYIKAKYQKPGEVYLGLVHRLDRPVGGIMVFARTSKAAGRLSEQIRSRQFYKTYHTVIHGKPEVMQGRLEHLVVKNSKSNMVQVLPCPYNNDTEESEDRLYEKNRAVLEYQILQYREEENISLAAVNLITGRPHQIRAQFAFIGHPIIGDRKYGVKRNVLKGKEDRCFFEGKDRWQAQPTNWPALWATSIAFVHPVRSENMLLETALPKDYPWHLFQQKVDGQNTL